MQIRESWKDKSILFSPFNISSLTLAKTSCATVSESSQWQTKSALIKCTNLVARHYRESRARTGRPVPDSRWLASILCICWKRSDGQFDHENQSTYSQSLWLYLQHSDFDPIPNLLHPRLYAVTVLCLWPHRRAQRGRQQFLHISFQQLRIKLWPRRRNLWTGGRRRS